MGEDKEVYLDYLENRLLSIRDKLRSLGVQELTDSDKYYRLEIEKETLETVRDVFVRMFFGENYVKRNKS
mgnify:CR=1 FL=1